VVEEVTVNFAIDKSVVPMPTPLAASVAKYVLPVEEIPVVEA
jgi:hypothetical protein